MFSEKIEKKNENKIFVYNNKMLRPIQKFTRQAKKKIKDTFDTVPNGLWQEIFYTAAYNELVKENNDKVKEERRVERNRKAKEKRALLKDSTVRMYEINLYITLQRVNADDNDTFESRLSEYVEANNKDKDKVIGRAIEAFFLDVQNRYGDSIHLISIDDVVVKSLINLTDGVDDEWQEMRDILPLDGYGDQSWNKYNGTCVLDYLRHTYEGKDGYKNKNGKYWLTDDAFKLINYLLVDNIKNDKFNQIIEKKTINNDESKILNKMIKDAKQNAKYSHYSLSVTMHVLHLWCIINNISHYALDTNENLVTGLRYVRNQKFEKGRRIPPLVYQYKNHHFNPVIDPKRVLSISQYGNGNNHKIQSENIDVADKKEVDCESIEIFDLMKKLPKIINEHSRDLQNRNIRVKETIKNCIEVDSIYIKEKKVKYFNLNDEEIQFKHYCQENGVEYKRQSLSTLGLNLIGDVKKSHMNPLVFNTFETNGISHRVHHGQTREFNKDLLKDAQAFDINKHYSAVLLQLGEVGVIQFQDDFVKYDGSNIDVGYYFVKTNDMSLLHGSNIYSHRIVSLALTDGLIQKSDIKLMLKCSSSIPPLRFKEFVNNVYKMYGKNFGKRIVNRAVGCFNQTSKNKYDGVGLTNSQDELMTRVKLDKKYFVKEMFIEGQTYYLYGNKNSVMCPTNNRPLWQSILDESNIILYETAKSIGGTVLFRKTDCLVIHGAKNINVSNEIGGYKIEEKLPDNLDLVEEERHIKVDEIEEVNVLPYHTSDSLPEIVEFCKDKGLLISGRGGVGKTYSALKLIEEYDIKLKLAFTNKATININGSTIDSYLKLKDGKICSHWANKLKANYVIVDEISMLSSRYWSLLCDLKRMTGAKFILLGDYRQCQPIECDDTFHKETTRDFNYQSAINYLTDYNRVDFDVFNPKARYDKDLWNVSEEVFNGDLSSTQDLEIDFKECDLVNATNICYLNTTRKSINKIVNEKLKPADAVFLKCNDDDGQDAYLYEGLKVILSKTIKEKEDKIFSKNETSTITKMENDKLTIGDKYTFDLKDFHKVCLLGYATTTYKSQGDTCDGVINIFNWKHSLMNGNLRYTAITRATGLRNVKIINGFIETYAEAEGVVYMCVCSETGNKYIGSTRHYDKRVKSHQSPDNDCSSKQLINPTFHILAKYPSISKKQLLRMEQKYMNSVECINQQKATKE